MKLKIILPALALVFTAAACNRSTPPASPAPAPPQSPEAGPAPIPTPAPTPAPAPATVVPPPPPITSVAIVISDSGFMSKDITVKKGGTVTFVNNSSKLRWPASAPHPTHTDYPEFDAKQGIAVGQSWSFTFEKTGTWKYHDHLQPTFFGSISVTE